MNQHSPERVREDQQAFMEWATSQLQKATGDGARKRLAGEKVDWREYNTHYYKMFSHIMKGERGDRVDLDSGADPYVHVAWRALAHAYRRQEWLKRLDERDSAYD